VPVIVDGLQMIRPGIAVRTEPAVLPRQAGDGPELSAGLPAAEKAAAPSGGPAVAKSQPPTPTS
jgi:hypothetical protein